MASGRIDNGDKDATNEPAGQGCAGHRLDQEISRTMLAEKQPMTRFSTPEVTATITGAPISVDGGWVAQ